MTSNILFIVIDSLRANYCYDHKKSYSTPNLDQIIKKGTYFTESITCADGTGLVLGSIFTGLNPYHSGINSFIIDTEKPNFLKVTIKCLYRSRISVPNHHSLKISNLYSLTKYLIESSV